MHKCYTRGERMKIENILISKEYFRIIEGMGEGLVLFKVIAKNKRAGQNYHIFFEDKRKPPLDIAINPKDGTLEYVSFFAQDENIIKESLDIEIIFEEGIITIRDEQFSENNANISQLKDFLLIKSDDDILALNSIQEKSIKAYKINQFNFLLFTPQNEFCGVLLKKINDDEMNEIVNSKCII